MINQYTNKQKSTILDKNKYQNIFFRENFYTLAWTTLQFGDTSTESSGKSNHLKSNILVSGGIRGEIRMFHPENKVS